MPIGFDYGTSNSSVSHVINGDVQAIPLVGEDVYIPSSLCAPNRETVTEYLFRHLDIMPAGAEGESLLRGAINNNRREGITVLANDVKFGKKAIAQYLQDPVEYYYVKSPKSFLGLLSLSQLRLAIFEDLVCAMMANVKASVESSLNRNVTQTVIGRPVNFHKRGGDASNQQALGILSRAAYRAGFKDVEFLYEPVAAGLDFEATLIQDQTVLVVDVGGGTTDCSILRMGPSWAGKLDREAAVISHTGKFIGGNDLDIAITFQRLMKEFGKGTDCLNGRPIPIMLFWDAIAINDVKAQKRFFANDHHKALKQIADDAQHPDKVSRLLRIYEDTLNYAIVQQAEDTKIALGQTQEYTAKLDLISEVLNVPVNRDQLASAIETPLRHIQSLVKESVKQAGVAPDTVYITGGSARSPILLQAISQVLPNTPIANGDFDGSVTSGLARWADLCFS